MISEFAKNPYDNMSRQYEDSIKTTIGFLIRKVVRSPILDIGEQSPLTDALRLYLPSIEIDNTEGDIDEPFVTIPGKKYNAILYSHIIEHQFNPLFTLQFLKSRLEKDGRIFIITPHRGKLLWDKGHYHEIDHYRMIKLIERAGYKILNYELHKVRRAWYSYLTGIRPLLRLFFEYNGYYEIKQKEDTP